jgi:hypothetical protein
MSDSIQVVDGPEYIWQRRELDIQPDTDYTQNEIGVEAILLTRTVEACPACGRPAICMAVTCPWGTSTAFIHKRNQAQGEATEVCMAVPPGQPTLVLCDKDGNETYRGTPMGGASGN